MASVFDSLRLLSPLMNAFNASVGSLSHACVNCSAVMFAMDANPARSLPPAATAAAIPVIVLLTAVAADSLRCPVLAIAALHANRSDVDIFATFATDDILWATLMMLDSCAAMLLPRRTTASAAFENSVSSKSFMTFWS